MKCPSCDKRVTGSRCSCGWADVAIAAGVRPTCSWTSESRTCAMITTASGLCAWHRDWLRLIDDGAPGRTDHEEFADWWDQFQPYGAYGSHPGPWWAAIDVLWAALRGLSTAPMLTKEIDRELFLRRSEVHRYEHGLSTLKAPWVRVTGLPLPPWSAELWHTKVDARVAQRNKVERETVKV